MTKKQPTQPQSDFWEPENWRSAIPEVVVLRDEELQEFHDWLQARGDDPHIALTLRWIAEFEAFAEDDEQALLDVKVMLRDTDDPRASMALRLITLMEETEEPEPMLRRLNTWLRAKCDDSTALLARWWLAEFEGSQKNEDQSTRTYH